jgi:hypothetical protein
MARAAFLCSVAGWQHARSILEQCLPYLKTKRARAELFIEIASTMRRNGRTKEPVLERRNAIVLSMKALNQRGSYAVDSK